MKLSRIDMIGQNGGTGEHYGHVLPGNTGPDNILMKIAEASYRMDKMDVIAEERILYLTKQQYEWLMDLREGSITGTKHLERIYNIRLVVLE